MGFQVQKNRGGGPNNLPGVSRPSEKRGGAFWGLR